QKPAAHQQTNHGLMTLGQISEQAKSLRRRPTIRRLESQAAVGPTTIVMIDKYSERSHEVPCVQDQQPVQAFRPNRPNEPLRDPIRLRDLNRRTNNARALRLKDDIETARELSIMVANRTGSARESVHATCRACCVTHSPSGCAVQPARYTRRLAIPMKNSTHNRWSQTVSTAKKSTAMTLFACACRNSRHDGPLRVPAGPTRRRWVHWTL